MIIAPIAVSCGEPAGIGLELAEKAWSALRNDLAFFLIADPNHLPGNVPVRILQDPASASQHMATGLPVLPHSFASSASPGQPDPLNADGVLSAISRGAALAMSGSAAALCTLPIHKKALKDGTDFPWPGHTEYLAHLGGVDQVVMMLASDQLKVVPTTIHIPLAQVATTLTAQLLRDTIRITALGLQRQFGIKSPRLAVAGLNPHAGEGGAMGFEDIEIIAPVIAEMRALGYDLTGPLSADTMFHAAARARYDAAICMYHDQALIPIKTLDFDRGVNVTLGLPFIRTSPDHGTAFDIAGLGRATPTSTIQALRMAHQMAQSA